MSRRIVAGIGMAVGMSVAAAAPASANDLWLENSGDEAFLFNYSRVIVVDHTCDGVTARARYTAVAPNGATFTGSVTDWNGCSAGSNDVFLDPWRVTAFQLCHGSLCTPWFYP